MQAGALTLSVAKLTRRSLLSSVASLTLLGVISANAAPIPTRGGNPIPGGASTINGMSRTIYNIATSPSAINTPVIEEMQFAIGDIPSGYIAEPKIGSTTLRYQVDAVRRWGDGSLKNIRSTYFLPVNIPGNKGSTQVVYTKRLGSYNNTSTVLPSIVAADGRDFTIKLDKLHTAQVGGANGKGSGNQCVTSLTIDSTLGQIVSGITRFFVAGNLVTAPIVTGGGGTGATISINGTTGDVTIIDPGSGFGYIDGATGTLFSHFNDIVTAVGTPTGHISGYSIDQYAKGPLVDAWCARMKIWPHVHVAFYIERYKNADGSLFDYFYSAQVSNGMIDLVNPVTNLTGDWSFYDGATPLQGFDAGDIRYQTITWFAGTTYSMLDQRTSTMPIGGRGYWLTNDAARKSVIALRNPQECEYVNKTRQITPWRWMTPATVIPTIEAYYENTANGGIERIPLYVPGGSAGVRAPLGAGGAGSQETAMQTLDNLFLQAQHNGDIDAALIWLNSILVGAAHSLGFGSQGAAILEDTMYPANCIPATVQTFPGMTSPTREAKDAGSIPVSGYCHPMYAGGTIASYQSAVGSTTYHQVGILPGACMWDGAQFLKDGLGYAAANPIFGRSYSFSRQATLGTTTYYGVYASQSFNVRVPTWAARTQGMAVALIPPVWADGTSNPIRAYLDYCTGNHFKYLYNLASFTGTVKFGSVGAAQTKTVVFTNGVYPENFTSAVGTGTELDVRFMRGYEWQVVCQLSYNLQGTTTGGYILQYLHYIEPYSVGYFAGTSNSIYGKIAYRITMLTDRPPNTPQVTTDWSLPLDPVNPRVYIIPFGVTINTYALMRFQSGSSVVNLNDNSGVFWRTGEVIANGTRIKLTMTNDGSGATSTGAFPASFSTGVGYYWKQTIGDPSSGQLCSDAGLTTPIVATRDSRSTITIGGLVVTAGDVISLIIASSGISGSPITLSYTATAADAAAAIATGRSNIAAGLQAAYNASVALTGSGMTITRSGAVLTFNPPEGLAHVTFTSSVTGAASETVTITGLFEGNFVMVPSNVQPANNSGSYWYETLGSASTSSLSRLAQYYGEVNLGIVYGQLSNPTAALQAQSNLSDMYISCGIDETLLPEYAFASSV